MNAGDLELFQVIALEAKGGPGNRITASQATTLPDNATHAVANYPAANVRPGDVAN